MKTKNFILYLILIFIANINTAFCEKVAKSNIKEEAITYTLDNTVFKGFVAYDKTLKGKLPAVLVIPEWWGLTEYPKMRARQLAQLGYIAFAVDMYGDGKIATNPTEAQALTVPFYGNPQLSKTRLDAAINKIKQYKQTDPANVFAIGYCFGGAVVLNCAKLGSNLKGVVSFHGTLKGVSADRSLLKADILVCQGGNDKFAPEADQKVFKHQLDSIGAKYSFITYPSAMHAFTNPEATETGKKFSMPIEYNKAADLASWKDMKKFLSLLVPK